MQLFNIQWKWNIPNILSLLRLALVPGFAVLYLLRLDMWAFATLLVSGVTDFLDGFLARRLNQITDCGKLLDPLSDKLTQVTVLVCLTTRYSELIPLTVICFVKELCQAIGGAILLHRHSPIRSAKWFGKVSTVVFYLCMLVLVLWRDVLIERAFWALILLVVLTCATTLWAFLRYLRLFIEIHRAEKSQPSPSAAPTEKG